MFARLGSFTHRRRWWVLAVAALLTVLAGALGPAVSEAVTSGGFEDPGAESTRAQVLMEEALGRTEADVVVLWTRDDLTTDDRAFEEAVTALLVALPGDATERILQPWTPGLPVEVADTLRADDGHTAMAVLSLTGSDVDARSDTYERIADRLIAPAPWETHVAGSVPVATELQHTAEEDISRAEMLAMPVLLILMVLIFGSLTAAVLPLVTGVVAILGAMGLLRLLTTVTDVSTFALNVTTILGLGLAIDYALFMVSRFREELGSTSTTGGAPDVAAAVSRTVATAGRTVAFSGLTVLIAFAGLLFFPQMFLRSMGLGGMAVVLLDMVLALTMLPALLAVLGPRVDAGRLPRGLTARIFAQRVQHPGAASRPGAWERFSAAVLRRPLRVVVAATVGLGILAVPALDLRPGLTDARDLPTSAVSRQAVDALESRFPSTGTTLDVVVRGDVSAPSLADYAERLAGLPAATGAAVVASGTGAGGDTVIRLTVSTDGQVDDPDSGELVAAVRGLPLPPGATETLVGGAAAVHVDSTAAIVGTLPATLSFVAGVTMLLLFLALGSVVLPLKAVLMNVVSLAATTGFVVWAFGEGHLAGLLGFTETGRVDPSNLVLIAVISFGLAMDYELFLLSRIREEHLRGAGQAESIGAGLQRSGRTITSAALLLVVVLGAMATSGVTFLKLIGLGLAVAVVVDATVVRALLVPATMRLLGGANWWLPAPLARVHARIGFAEGDTGASPVVVDAVVPPSEVPAGELVSAGR